MIFFRLDLFHLMTHRAIHEVNERVLAFLDTNASAEVDTVLMYTEIRNTY